MRIECFTTESDVPDVLAGGWTAVVRKCGDERKYIACERCYVAVSDPGEDELRDRVVSDVEVTMDWVSEMLERPLGHQGRTIWFH